MKKESSAAGTGPKHPPRALRIVCSYVGSDIRLVSRQSIEMTPPPSDPLATNQEQAGFWYEVRDEKERAWYRRIGQNPIRFAAEVRSDDPDRPLSWQDVKKPRGEFVVVIPDRADARLLVFFSTPLAQKAAGNPAREIARVDLSEGRAARETT